MSRSGRLRGLRRETLIATLAPDICHFVEELRASKEAQTAVLCGPPADGEMWLVYYGNVGSETG